VKRGTIVFLLLPLLAGIVTMVQATRGSDSGRAWEVYLVNLLFWSGISQAGLIMSAVMVMTNASWWRPIRRIAEGMTAFLPASFVLFVIFFAGARDLFPWVDWSAESRSPWLDWDALVWRDIGAISLLYIVSFVYLFVSIRMQRDGVSRNRSKTIRILSPILVLIYAIVYSLLAIDLIMTLSPPWFSTLFGAYFFIGNLYTGLAMLAILAVFLQGSPGGIEPIERRHRRDIARLILAFCMITGDFFWSQFLVIWYGNLPEEIMFLLRRVDSTPWAILSWTVLVIAFIVPFLVLLSRRMKVNRAGLAGVSVIILVGMWLERYVLVVPSVYPGDSIPFGWTELGISIGFLSLCAISFILYLRSIPFLYADSTTGD
jgi:Ni/Fe-hydrogenase subunit HybB-like protein